MTTNAKRAVTPLPRETGLSQPKWRIEFYPPKRPTHSAGMTKVKVIRCKLVWKAEDLK